VSEIEEWSKIVRITIVIGAITSPIWAHPYIIWCFLLGGKQKIDADDTKYEQERLEREAHYKILNENRVPAKPLIFSSISQKSHHNN
jgi:hypothetical protein